MSRRDDFLVGPKEKAQKAIKSGNVEEALLHLDEACDMYRSMHDSLIVSSSLMQGLLAEAHGEEWLEEYNRKRVLETYRPIFGRLKNMAPEQIVQYLSDRAKRNYSEFHVEEDGEKFALVSTGCGNGGMLIKDGIARKQNAVTKKAYPWSFNRIGFPYYCVHAYFYNELFKELGVKVEVQWGRQYDDDGNKINEPCKYVVYK